MSRRKNGRDRPLAVEIDLTSRRPTVLAHRWGDSHMVVAARRNMAALRIAAT